MHGDSPIYTLGTEPGRADNSDDLMSDAEAEACLARVTQPIPREWTQGANMLDIREIADKMGVTREAVENRYQAGQIIGLDRYEPGLIYPLDQFARDESTSELVWLPGLDRVVAFLGNSWQAWIWLHNARDDLRGRTPLAALHAGDPISVEIALGRDDDGVFG